VSVKVRKRPGARHGRQRRLRQQAEGQKHRDRAHRCLVESNWGPLSFATGQARGWISPERRAPLVDCGCIKAPMYTVIKYSIDDPGTKARRHAGSAISS
jgi:hypothetical protein